MSPKNSSFCSVGFLALALGLGGCVIPVTQTVRIGENRSLRVIDERTSRPLSGASASYAGSPERSFSADASGRVELQEITQQKTYWLPPAPVCPPPWSFDSENYRVLVRAPGYAEWQVPQQVARGSTIKRPPQLTVRLAPTGLVAPAEASPQRSAGRTVHPAAGFATPP